MTDLENTTVRIAPSVPVENPVEAYCTVDGITVQVVQHGSFDSKALDPLLDQYCIPRRPQTPSSRPKVQ